MQGIRDELPENSILTTYDAVKKVTSALSSDWLTSSSVTTTLLLSKGLGFFLITLGRNIGDWPTDVSLSEVSTGNQVDIMEELFCTLSLYWMTSGTISKIIFYSLSFIFMKLEGYSAPSVALPTYSSAVKVHQAALC